MKTREQMTQEIEQTVKATEEWTCSLTNLLPIADDKYKPHLVKIIDDVAKLRGHFINALENSKKLTDHK